MLAETFIFSFDVIGILKKDTGLDILLFLSPSNGEKVFEGQIILQ